MTVETMELDNDTRGWIMCITSGTACFFGALIICVDVFVRMIPGQQNFRIEESNGFLACSLSVSFGVMVSLLADPIFPSFLLLTFNCLALFIAPQHAPRGKGIP